MSLERSGAAALFVGAAAYIALMAVHPSHGGGDPMIGPFTLSGIVHGTALVMKPILLFGFVVFTRQQGFDRPLPLLALCFYGLASVFTMLAGTMSGIVFPYMIEAAHAPGGDVDSIQTLAQYTTWLNRSFAKVHTAMVSIAILLWCIGWAAKAPMAWIARIVGVVVGLGILAWYLSGTINLEARQGALWITLAHGAWTILVAAFLFTNTAKAKV